MQQHLFAGTALALLFAMPTTALHAQVDAPVHEPIIEVPRHAVEEEQDVIYTIVEVMPEFPGGKEALLEYLQKNVVYPPKAQAAGISGTVYVTFVVRPDGSITDAKVLRGIGGGCDEEAQRVVKSMPNWKPGTQRGVAVPVQYNLPVRFK
ncbi:MAG: energy transducer TonB [Flavobacteriales bacterium]|nr:energy transducer TonB [Flavobacteriales bacterium]